MLPQVVLANFSQLSKRLENWNFCIPLRVTFCQTVRTVLQLGMRVGEGSQFVIKWPVFKKRNVLIYATNLRQYKCWEYCFPA